MIPFHGDKKDPVSAVQNYHIYQAIERAVQTILELKNCNILVMNRLKFGLFQTFSGGKSKEFRYFTAYFILSKRCCGSIFVFLGLGVPFNDHTFQAIRMNVS